MTPEEERWAEATTILRQRGDGSPAWIVERIGALALARDEAGVQRFCEIAGKVDEIMRAGRT